jgi:hypothetical protein
MSNVERKSAGDPGPTAEDWNRLVDRVNAQRIVAGPGIVVTETDGGVTVALDMLYLKALGYETP